MIIRDYFKKSVKKKTNIPYWNRSAMNTTFKDTLRRIDTAKSQNPNVKIIYEFPNNEAKSKMTEWLKENKEYKNVIDVIRVRGEK